MNIISRIFNAITPNVSATSPAPVTAMSAPAGVPSQGYRIGDPPQDIGKFEQTYGSPPYVDGSFRAGIFYGRPPGNVSPQTVEEIAEKIGAIIPPDEKKELDALYESDVKLDERMAECGFFMATIRATRAKQAAEAQIRAGETAIIPTREQMQQQMTVEREVIHELKRQNADKAFQILKPACDRFAKAAREFVLEEVQIEKAIHKQRHGGKPYTPGLYVQELCYVALALAYAPVRNYLLCRNLRAPDPAKPLIDLWIQSIPAAPVQSALPPQRSHAELMQAEMRAREASAAEERKAELVEKNALTEKIKADAQKVADEIELARVKAAMDADTRTAALKQKILDAAANTATKPTP
jgi:hypothetical protein